MEKQSSSAAGYTRARGSISPQGATLVNDQLRPCSIAEATGVNFAVYAPKAKQLILALFDRSGDETQLNMFKSPQGIWHIYVSGLTAGQLYGFRADGRWKAHTTPRFNVHKLLMDPYAREIQGEVQWCDQLFDYTVAEAEENQTYWVQNTSDSAPFMPRSVVRASEFDWQGTEKPAISDQNSVIYETHLKGFTRNHPDIPEQLRGTYLGMCHPVAIAYLKELGITAVELMPVTSKVSEQRLADLGLSNYWGYNPLCLMAPEPSLAVSDPVTELKTLVRELHRAGIEVILDVVFNHSCEAGHGGPILSMRGLAENEYYHIDIHDGQTYALNYSGCGNTMNFDSPQTLKLTMDALRSWADEYQVDGFRFDLAPIMARQHRMFNRHSPFFFAITQDPVLSQLKMIAEPWDIGPDGYQLTGFPGDWQSWNDRYRDGCRKFWNGSPYQESEMAARFCGSEDLFHEQTYLATVNYICSHDGFTLMDLVSYNERHNLDNREHNRDGDSHNNSWNHGVEGETSNRKVRDARLRSRKNLLATLMLAKGTPMLMAGDEFSNTQHGNNNAYCQDSSCITWQDWHWQTDAASDGARMQAFTRDMIALRRSRPLLTDHNHQACYEFFSPEGHWLRPDELSHYGYPGLLVRIHSDEGDDSEELYVLMNRSSQPIKVQLPRHSKPHRRWFVMMRTDKEPSFVNEPLLLNGWYEVPANSLTLIREVD
ncbi:glycogen debranching protein GlgX [Parendozoicomonas haliclonae]|uniref:Glycogen debranching enzyme n=1 Tax=Parendozoicomonas haliclonae TaxID=1960125 RepID=A0A1X7AI22_9GAMM|nr:glycogen debranching protein GlgX [Parendozoicomonas haliclonae]SMA44062.1 Glycogen debranching enzyme [Parendozoicomonas haliclonae]